MRIGIAVFAAVLLTTVSHGMAQERQPVPIKDFVLAIHTEGISYDVASKYSSEGDLKILHELLGEEQHAPYWPNITRVIGIVGGDSEVGRLISFVQGTDVAFDSSSTAVLRGRASAVSSLGYLARKESPRALSYLLDGVDPHVWRDRAPWLAEHEHEDWAATILSTSAVQGLAFSGKSEAASETLHGLLKDASTDESIRRRAESVLTTWAEIEPVEPVHPASARR